MRKTVPGTGVAVCLAIAVNTRCHRDGEGHLLSVIDRVLSMQREASACKTASDPHSRSRADAWKHIGQDTTSTTTTVGHSVPVFAAYEIAVQDLYRTDPTQKTRALEL